MTERSGYPQPPIFPQGTMVVSLREIIAPNGRTAHPHGSVGVVIRAPSDGTHSYRIRFSDGGEESLRRDEVVMLARYQTGEIGEAALPGRDDGLYERIIYRCVIGSRAYGLDDEGSDIDYRGVFLSPAERHWSLFGVPEQIECDATQEAYWELQKFLVLALKSNPNVLECLYTPLVEMVTPLGEELLDMREAFLSRLVYQTYNGYVMSQFKKMQTDLRNQGRVKWKHVMHLIRLLASGISVLREGYVPVRVEQHRERLLAIKRGEMDWDETEAWRRSLHRDFDRALAETKLPELPDYARVNSFLIKARRLAVEGALP